MYGPSGISRGSNQFIKLKEVFAVEQNKWLAVSKKIDGLMNGSAESFAFLSCH